MADDCAWSDPAMDDSDWQTIRPGLAWEKQGFAGYAWYRLHVRMPESLRKTPGVQRHQSLTVTLGRIDDVDQTWFNGKLIGSTGKFPDSYQPAYLTTRVYRVSCSLECAEEGVITSTTMTLGYRPEQIESALTRQNDFDEFWRKTLAAL